MDTGKKLAGKQYVKEAYRALFDHDFARAVRAFEKAIQCEPTNASYYFKLSVTYARNQQLILAIRAIEQALVLDQGNEKFMLQHQRLVCRQVTEEAAQYIEQGEIPQALTLSRQAIDLDPLYVRAHYIMAYAYFLQGNYIQARKAARQAVRLDPESELAKRLLARCREQAMLEKKSKKGT
ncbi:tetratricopeptide repeat protein [Aneurinibacillus sp. REN35]|uniref:tetratricopeptide repeat protein n=1 Tax=Aneurinibacillus sp. REN35 TaxID=3237286 RepID=UPI003528C6FE